MAKTKTFKLYRSPADVVAVRSRTMAFTFLDAAVEATNHTIKMLAVAEGLGAHLQAGTVPTDEDRAALARLPEVRQAAMDRIAMLKDARRKLEAL